MERGNCGNARTRGSLLRYIPRAITCSLLAILLLSHSYAGPSTQRDIFTTEEVELVRDAQQIDKRIEILTKIIDRRFAALNIEVGGAKISPKDSQKWGELPKSTRFELLLDVKRIIQKAIDDIDSLAERPDSMVVEEPEKGKKPKGYAELFPKAVRILAASARRYQPALRAELDRDSDPAEKGSILDSLESCEQIIAAVAKLPTEVQTATPKKKH